MGVTNYLPNGMILQVVSLVWDVLRKRVASKESKETSPKSHHPILPQIGFHFLRVTMKWWLWKAKSQMLSPRQRPTQQGGDDLETSESTELGFNHKKRLPDQVRKLIPWCWERDQRNKKAIFQSSRKQDPWPIFNFWWMAPRKLGKIGPPDGWEWLPKDAFPLQEKDAAASLLDEQQASTSSSVRIELEDPASDVWTLDTWQLLDHAAQFLHVCRLQFLEMDSRLPIIHQQLLKLTSILLLPPDPSWIFWTNTSLHVFFFWMFILCSTWLVGTFFALFSMDP